jgi:hypothetical protein
VTGDAVRRVSLEPDDGSGVTEMLLQRMRLAQVVDVKRIDVESRDPRIGLGVDVAHHRRRDW